MSVRLERATRVLVRAPAWLGDFVAAEPVLRALVDRSRITPGAPRVSVVAPQPFFGLLDPAQDDRWSTLQPIASKDAAQWRGHDLALLLTGSFRSAWTAWRAGIPERVGWIRDARRFLLTGGYTPQRERGHTPWRLGRHGSYPRYLPRPFGSSCVELATSVGLEVRERRPRLAASHQVHAAVANRLAAWGLGTAPFVLANAGARPRSAKAYPAESWVQVFQELARELDLPIVLVCGPGEEASLGQICERASGLSLYAWTDPCADLRELLALCERAELLLTSDSGPRHLAVATGTPVVVAFGPTDRRHTEDHLSLTQCVDVEVPCGPCHREVCPLSGEAHHVCMRSIDPAELARAAAGALG